MTVDFKATLQPASLSRPLTGYIIKCGRQRLVGCHWSLGHWAPAEGLFSRTIATAKMANVDLVRQPLLRTAIITFVPAGLSEQHATNFEAEKA